MFKILTILGLMFYTTVLLSQTTNITDDDIDSIDYSINMKHLIKLSEGTLEQKRFAYLYVSTIIDAAKNQRIHIEKIEDQYINECEIRATTIDEVNRLFLLLKTDTYNHYVTKDGTIGSILIAYNSIFCDMSGTDISDKKIVSSDELI